MGKNFVVLLVLCGFLLFSITAPGVSAKDAREEKSGSGNLIINISGFESNNGDAKIALVDSRENYEKGESLKRKIVPVKDKKVRYIVRNIKFGRYAVKAFHDANRNGRLDTAMFGIPVEAYGFSNNARGTFGPPDYSKVVFQFTVSGQEIFIKIR